MKLKDEFEIFIRGIIALVSFILIMLSGLMAIGCLKWIGENYQEVGSWKKYHSLVLGFMIASALFSFFIYKISKNLLLKANDSKLKQGPGN
jgi:hypothetical protein